MYNQKLFYFQVLKRRRSTGSSDRKSWARIDKDDIKRGEDSDKDSLGDDKVSSSDSEDHGNDGNDICDGFSFNIDPVSHILRTNLTLTNRSPSMVSREE